MGNLALVFPDIAPYIPHRYEHCVVIGNSGELLKTKFGKEIENFDVVIQGNGAPTKISMLKIMSLRFISIFLHDICHSD